jgi:hypothetical protein
MLCKYASVWFHQQAMRIIPSPIRARTVTQRCAESGLARREGLDDPRRRGDLARDAGIVQRRAPEIIARRWVRPSLEKRPRQRRDRINPAERKGMVKGGRGGRNNNIHRFPASERTNHQSINQSIN